MNESQHAVTRIATLSLLAAPLLLVSPILAQNLQIRKFELPKIRTPDGMVMQPHLLKPDQPATSLPSTRQDNMFRPVRPLLQPPVVQPQLQLNSADALALRKIAAARQLQQRGGVPIAGVVDGWFFTDMNGYQLAGQFLQQGLIGERRGATFGMTTPFDLQVIDARQGSYVTDVTSRGAEMVIYQGQRGQGQRQGESSGEIRFLQFPDRGPDRLADPRCPLLKPGYYERAIYQQDAVTETMRGERGGLFAIGKSGLGDPVRYSVKPCSDDLLIAWDVCDKNNWWGQTFTIQLPVRVSALYHAHNPRTTKTASGWEMDNQAQLVKQQAVVWLPCTVRSVAKVQLRSIGR